MIEQINNDLVVSMKEQDKFTLSVLRMLKSALQLESINKKAELTDDEVISVVKKQVKMRNDSILEFKKFDKMEAVKKLEEEIEILNKYLPECLSEEQIDEAIEKAFEKINPTSMKDMGLIMKELQSIATRCDMSEVSRKVKEKLMQQ